MPDEIEQAEIVICLGSSCFARGNSQNLAIIEEFIQNRGLEASVRLSGKLCQDECRQGPNLMIAGETYREITADKLRQILQKLGKRAREG